MLREGLFSKSVDSLDNHIKQWHLHQCQVRDHGKEGSHPERLQRGKEDNEKAWMSTFLSSLSCHYTNNNAIKLEQTQRTVGKILS